MTMNKTDLRAEALFQLAVAQRSGVKSVVWVNDDSEMIVLFNNGTVTINDYAELKVQFELHSQLYVVGV